MRRLFVTATLTALGLIGPVAFGAEVFTSPANPSVQNREVRTSVKELMESIIDPSADVLWRAVGTVVDKGGFHDALPKTSAEWQEVRGAAVRIIEGGNLLMMPGRAAAPAGTRSEVPGVELEPAEMAVLINRNRASFDGFALALQGVAVQALKGIDAKNGDMLMDAGGRMEEVCESCHQSFWYPNAAGPPPPPQPAGRSGNSR